MSKFKNFYQTVFQIGQHLQAFQTLKGLVFTNSLAKKLNSDTLLLVNKSINTLIKTLKGLVYSSTNSLAKKLNAVQLVNKRINTLTRNVYKEVIVKKFIEVVQILQSIH
jgi:hypothetical protein